MNKKIPLIFGGVLLLILAAGIYLNDHEILPAQNPDASSAQQNLNVLMQTEIPENSAYAIAAKYKNIHLDPDEPTREKITYALGDTRQFYILDMVTNAYTAINATLQYSTAHLYFWIEESVDFEREDVAKLCEEFEGQIYPLNREFFGSEKTPGIDSDEHLFIVYTTKMTGALGYFSSADTLPRAIEPYSNEAEIFMLSASYAYLDDESTYGVLAHEFQHMIHQNLDANESTWVNEGFSELAVLLNGYDPGGTDWLYARNPDIQLNFWPRDEVESTLPHYGASFIFMTYLYDRFGEEFSRRLVADPANGLTSIDEVLADLQERSDGEELNADDVFQDWSIANLLQDTTIEDGRYGYKSLPELSSFRVDGKIDCTTAVKNPFTVRQYGVDYFSVECDHPVTIQFSGDRSIPVVPVDPHSGEYYFWSNKADQSDMTLTQTFDFRSVEGPIILEYYVWYDLETDWDYVYLLASENGKEWLQLKPAHCTEENISGSNLGCGYNGASGGWVVESVDLTEYAGKTVTLQFEYLTDSSLTGEGFLLDGMRIESIGYETDFEEDEGGWVGKGFVRMMNSLPQTYRVAVINKGVEETTVRRYTVLGNEPLILDLNATTNEEVFLVVSGAARYTEMPASYTIEFLD